MSEKSGGKATVSPAIREIQEGLAKIKDESERRLRLEQQQELKALQLKPFPNWPDDRRGAPNEVIRSSIFGVVGKGKRRRVADFPVAGPAGHEITITGWRLDQHDCDIWLEIMHLARNAKPGESVRFSMRGLLRALGRSDNGSANRSWLKGRLKALAETTISFDGPRTFGVLGALIHSFEVDHETGEGVVMTNPKTRLLWESITHINIAQRQTLGSNQLAKSMHAVMSSHADWIPIRLDTLMGRVGAEYSEIRHFKSDIKTVLANFKQREWIKSYSFSKGSGSEILELQKDPTPTQLRNLIKRRNPKSEI
jgi:hypothetical protein